MGVGRECITSWWERFTCDENHILNIIIKSSFLILSICSYSYFKVSDVTEGLVSLFLPLPLISSDSHIFCSPKMILIIWQLDCHRCFFRYAQSWVQAELGIWPAREHHAKPCSHWIMRPFAKSSLLRFVDNYSALPVKNPNTQEVHMISQLIYMHKE